MTPLHLAAERARVEVVNYLAGKDIIDIQDRDGVNNFMCDCTDDERWSSIAYIWFWFGIISWHLREGSMRTLYISLQTQNQNYGTAFS